MKEKKRYQAKKLSPETVRDIENQVAELAEIIVSANYFVLDIAMTLENGRWYLRVYLDHPNPQVRVSLEDCADISEALGLMIDDSVKELKDFPYSLEVSSPGLFRKLESPREFRFYQGRRIEIKPKASQPFIAYLDSFDGDANELVYRLADEETAEKHRLAWEPKAMEVSLAPDLTQNIELKTVPRRIRRDD